MMRFLLLLLLALPAEGRAPAPFLRKVDAPFVGKWLVRFQNGVIEGCEIEADGATLTAEPVRISRGKARMKDGAVLIASDDDRLERWSMERGRIVVEHWFPASAYPGGAAVRGEAQRVR